MNFCKDINKNQKLSLNNIEKLKRNLIKDDKIIVDLNGI